MILSNYKNLGGIRVYAVKLLEKVTSHVLSQVSTSCFG
jgi:hypothetical protein